MNFYQNYFFEFSICQFCILLFGFFIPTTLAVYECHSCLQSCETTADGRLDPETCDCVTEGYNSNQTTPSMKCFGAHCFAKIEFFPDEATAIIQKGCTEGLSKGIDGCHYAGQVESIHCYCQGDLCNNKQQPLPTLECCECSQPGGDACPDDKCLRTCRGNYCLVDFDGVEQGCGLGLPRLQSFLRIPDYLQRFQGQSTCARYQAALTTSVHGCVCTKPTGMCNDLEKMRHYQTEKVIKRRLDDQNYCYSLHERSYDHEFDKGVYNNSETCEGHYCFVVLTTTELVVEVRNEAPNASNSVTKQHRFVGKSTPRFEVLAGCLKVDDDEKVSLGCTVEYTGDGNIISKHCICDSHLCNIFDLSIKNKHQNISEEVSFSGTGIFHDDSEVIESTNYSNPLIITSWLLIILVVFSIEM